MCVYNVTETKRCGVSLLDDTSSAKTIPGLLAVSQIKVSIENPLTIAAPLSSSLPPELFLFQDQANLRKHLQSTSRFLRNNLAVIDSKKVVKKKEVLDIYSMEVKPIMLPDETEVCAQLMPAFLPVAQNAAAEGVENEEGSVSDVTEISALIEENTEFDEANFDDERVIWESATTLSDIAEEDEEDEALIGAVGGAVDEYVLRGAGTVKKERPLKSILKKASSAQAFVSPDVLYFTPPGLKESYFNALIYFSKLRGQKISKDVQARLKKDFIESAEKQPLDTVIKEFLLVNKDKFKFVESKQWHPQIEVVTGALTEDDLEIIEIECEIDREIVEKEKAKPIDQKELYKENQFLAQLFLTPEPEWITNKHFISFIKMICFENNIDFDAYHYAELSQFPNLTDQSVDAKVARFLFEHFKKKRAVFPAEYKEILSVNSLISLFNKIPEMDEPPSFLVLQEGDPNKIPMSKFDYDYIYHFWIQAIERFYIITESQSVDDVLMALIESASLNLKRQREPIGFYRQMLNLNPSREPAFRPPKRVKFQPEVNYVTLKQENNPLTDEYIPFNPLAEEIKLLDFGLDKVRDLYYDEQIPYKKHLKLLSIANYYDGMWKTDFLSKVRKNEITTLDKLEYEVGVHVSSQSE